MKHSIKKSAAVHVQNTKYSAFWYIWFPIFTCIFIVLTLALLLFTQISYGQQSLQTWVDISIIFVTLMLFLLGLVLLLFLVGVITTLISVNQLIPKWLGNLQRIFFKASNYIIGFAQAVPKPIAFIKSIIGTLPVLKMKKRNNQ